MLTEPQADRWQPLIQDNRQQGIFRVNRQAFTDPEVLVAERRAIFETCWIYCAHESEIASSGSFISRSVAGKPLLLTRDRNNVLNVFYNSCMHRGALVCREHSGRARNFTCPYHGWVYSEEGQLVHQPIPESYAANCNADGALNLQRVPHFDVHAGFIFVNFSEHPESLRDYLAGAGEYLEHVAIQGEHGMEIIGGTQTYSAHANWKLLQENSVDGYHAESTHATYLAYIKNREGKVLNNYGKVFGRVRNLGNGHAVSESVNGTPWGRPSARWMPSWGEDVKREIDQVYAKMVARIGEERATFLCHGDRNLLIFPNLIVNDVSGLTIRTVYPKSPDYFEVSAWALGARHEPPMLRELRLRNYVEFLGPGGLATPDDQEMLELCQRGYAAAPGAAWNDLSRGLSLEETEASKMDELQIRTFWRRWLELLQRDGGNAASMPSQAASAAPLNFVSPVSLANSGRAA
ncbi:MAG: aromatic ring-hydroxylating oxygenase subunit alpha [Janthinobacterium lividum]